MMKFTLLGDGSVTRDTDGAVIPPDPANGDWQAYQAWLAAGNTPIVPPPPLPPAVPEVITDRQCFQQLAVLDKVTQDEALAAGTVGALPKAVADGIAGLPPDQQFAARMLLCCSTEFHRSHPMVPAFLGMLGMSTADGDALWTAAAKL